MRPDILNPLFAEVEVLKGIGPQLAKPLHRLGARPGGRHPLPSAGELDRPQAGRALDEADVGRIDHRRADRRATIARAGRAARSGSTPRTSDGNYRHADLFPQSGLGEEAASARRAADRLGQARPLRPGAADRPSGLCAAARTRPPTIPEREPVYPLSEGLTNHRIGRPRRPGAGAAARACANGSSRASRRSSGWPDWAEALETAHRDPAAAEGARAARL